MTSVRFKMRFLFFFIVALSILSCGEDDELMIDTPDPAITMNCDSLFVLRADTEVTIDFNGKGQAYVYRNTCEEFNPSIPPPFGYHYLILDVNWEGFGWTPRHCDVLDGVPGIIFGSIDIPEPGDVLEPYIEGPDGLYQSSDPAVRYTLGNTLITIEETGTEVGEFIGGTISGSVFAQNDENDMADISGDFCVPIISVCE